MHTSIQVHWVISGGPSPLLLGATVAEHLKHYEENQPDVVDELRDSLSVDDVISAGGDDVDSLQEPKEQAIKIFRKGGFELHKWHSNAMELEESQPSDHSQIARHFQTSLETLKIWNSNNGF